MSSAASPGPLIGTCRVPGDKSVTQRALLLGAFADGRTHVRGALRAGDTRATADVVAALGAEIASSDGHPEGPAADGSEAASPAAADVVITGCPLPRSVERPLDCRNAGTAARLLLGLLAGRSGSWILDGDPSLRRRPMARVAQPLRSAGARIEGDLMPVTVTGARLAGVTHEVALPSAQVKSALLLSGLVAEGPTTVVQHVLTRDHTERMLPTFGVRLHQQPGVTTVFPGPLRGASVDVPGDPSAAAFVVVSTLLTPGSEVWVRDVGLWPRRTGFLRALERAGADVMVLRRDARDGAPQPADPRGDLRAAFAGRLKAFDIGPTDVPDLVDELPILALAAALADGTSRFGGLAELRLKESDRVATVAALLQELGVPVSVVGDELRITGVPVLTAAAAPDVSADHRLELTAAVAAQVCGRERPVGAAADVSFPGFGALLAGLRGTA